jgi:catechol 2,3-dioxygenase-like lactoylglutathione lyase family enzyme
LQNANQEAAMSTAQMHSDQVDHVDMKLEVVRLPVADIDRAKRFYEQLGWRLDADFQAGAGRIVHFTPPGSQCSIMFGVGVTPAAPGTVQGTMLIVDDIETARADLVSHGVAVSETFHFEVKKGRVAGPDPQGRSYTTWASFTDPDGNGWLLQEVKTRLPGRVTEGVELVSETAPLADLLRETEEHHGAYEATAPKHHWSAWYAAYIVAREHGRSPDEAAKDAARHMGL